MQKPDRRDARPAVKGGGRQPRPHAGPATPEGICEWLGELHRIARRAGGRYYLVRVAGRFEVWAEPRWRARRPGRAEYIAEARG